MIFHENRLLADDSREISYLIFSKIRKDVEKFVVCCSRDWRFKGHAPIEQTNRCLSLPLSLEQKKLMGCEGTHKLYPAVEYQRNI